MGYKFNDENSNNFASTTDFNSSLNLEKDQKFLAISYKNPDLFKVYLSKNRKYFIICSITSDFIHNLIFNYHSGNFIFDCRDITNLENNDYLYLNLPLYYLIMIHYLHCYLVIICYFVIY